MTISIRYLSGILLDMPIAEELWKLTNLISFSFFLFFKYPVVWTENPQITQSGDSLKDT